MPSTPNRWVAVVEVPVPTGSASAMLVELGYHAVVKARGSYSNMRDLADLLNGEKSR